MSMISTPLTVQTEDVAMRKAIYPKSITHVITYRLVTCRYLLLVEERTSSVLPVSR